MRELLSNNLWMALMLIGLACGLTFVIFHWSKFDRGYEKGDAAHPDDIARDNPPDEWCKKHWENCTEAPSATKASERASTESRDGELTTAGPGRDVLGVHLP